MTTPVDLLTFISVLGAQGMGDKEKVHISWETPITVIVHGIIMSGYVISRERYTEMLLGQMRSAAVPSESEEGWKSIVDGLKRGYSEREKDPIAPPGSFLYLRDVEVTNVTRGGMIRNTLWCIKIADVGAVMLGKPAD